MPGLVVHTAGWPLDADTYGGSFLYHLENRQVAVGFVVGLGYRNPYLCPFEEFQRYKTHPAIRGFLEGGRRISYGARAIAAGGLQSLPKLVFPGGALVGDDAGFLNASRIKGTPRRDQVRDARRGSGLRGAGRRPQARRARGLSRGLRASWLHDELHRARNFKPWMSKGLYTGTLMVGIDQVLFRGKAPWTLTHPSADHETLRPKANCQPIEYPKPDGVLTFDRLSSVFVSNTNHEEDQPAHLRLKDPAIPDRGEPRGLRRARDALLSCRGVRVRDRGGDAPAADQRPELRALQDLRHQGPDAEHPLGRRPKGAAVRTTRTCSHRRGGSP